MAEEGDVITFVFTGVVGEDIPQNATRFIAHESVTVIPARIFEEHPNIVELICHAGVVRIEVDALYCYCCRRLRRVIIPGAKIVEEGAFASCTAVTYIECPKLERIGGAAFYDCTSLSGINLSSGKVVGEMAFANCPAMAGAQFGKELESIGKMVFCNCPSLESITIPLKNGLFAAEDSVFKRCINLKHVDLVEMAVLDETNAAFLLGEWGNDMNGEIESLNQILPNAPAGTDRYGDVGEKAATIRAWISRVLHKIVHYKAEHRRLLNVATTSLKHTLPNDIVMNNILPFLELPSHTFEGEDHEEKDEEEDGDNGSNSSDGSDESYDTSDGSDNDDDAGDDDDSNNEDELHNASFGGGRHEGGRGEEVQRKRRKASK